ncbi:probable nicotinate-nucleotide adenylyltransferase [Methylocaldum marinum]|uniref:Probable nicotinate-nucleotide adenylyltransferase n=1 Tax=Methylocaldum marinum TaxID=1432792 RepID=A0A250KZK6_9GAMM|nr:nicotinate-nucleotide adenylyltransferase [Methylocaldum marinum]BBA37108.1 probable nicotinate-nucleotide adenylyltransferase [Methylocaldum marinum]
MIGIYGGTFDPIHYGHLRTALEVKEGAGMDEIRFVPCRLPPHRAEPEADPALRLKMLELALHDAEPGFSIDTRELDRQGPSYMVETLASFRTEIGNRPLCLIAGLDAVNGFPRWHRWRELFELAHIVVMRRPGTAPDFTGDLAQYVAERSAEHAAALSLRPHGSIHFVDVTQLDISATRIRETVRSGKSARYLIPEPVLRFIESKRLYR